MWLKVMILLFDWVILLRWVVLDLKGLLMIRINLLCGVVYIVKIRKRYSVKLVMINFICVGIFEVIYLVIFYIDLYMKKLMEKNIVMVLFV